MKLLNATNKKLLITMQPDSLIDKLILYEIIVVTILIVIMGIVIIIMGLK